MRRLRLVVMAALAVIVAVLVIQNTDPVETRLLFATVVMPRAMLLVTTTLVGFALGVLTALIWLRPRKAETPASQD